MDVPPPYIVLVPQLAARQVVPLGVLAQEESGDERVEEGVRAVNLDPAPARRGVLVTVLVAQIRSRQKLHDAINRKHAGRGKETVSW